MAYFASIKITDVHGNIVELNDVTDLLKNILDELKKSRILLEEIAEAELTEEDIEDEDQ